MTSRRIPFSGSGLDRAHIERRDPQWLNAQLEDERSRFLPVWNLEMLVRTEEPRQLAWARAALARSASPESPPILLGLNEGVAHFAVDISNLADPVKELELGEGTAFEDLRAMGSLISSGEAAIAAQAGAWSIGTAVRATAPPAGARRSPNREGVCGAARSARSNTSREPIPSLSPPSCAASAAFLDAAPAGPKRCTQPWPAS